MVGIISMVAVNLLAIASLTRAHLKCSLDAKDLSSSMLNGIIARGQGLAGSGAATSTIELGIFQQALRESIACSQNATQRCVWEEYLKNSTTGSISTFSNSTADAGQPLDRLSVGTSMIYQYLRHSEESFVPAILALKESVRLQQQNADGGLWYYANPNNLSAYHNLSYSDGMFSYPAFAILSDFVFSESRLADDDELFGAEAAVKQISILYGICREESGLVVHGYDATKAHRWADPETGASPVVWGRSLAWYTLGILNSLDVLKSFELSCPALDTLTQLFNVLVSAQVAANDRSLQTEGTNGVWQIVDQPGASFGGHENFVEASASCMTAYSLLKGARLGLIGDEDVKSRSISTGIGIYRHVLQEFVIFEKNGSISLDGTSAVASLSGDVDFSYYASRPTILNSLIGTSACVMAGLEVQQAC